MHGDIPNITGLLDAKNYTLNRFLTHHIYWTGQVHREGPYEGRRSAKVK
jgi:hypothetical protein